MTFLLGGERPPNKKTSSTSKHALFAANSDEMPLWMCPRRVRVYDPIVVSRSDHKKIPSAFSAMNLDLIEAPIDPKGQ
jgi:hypothetical protein